MTLGTDISSDVLTALSEYGKSATLIVHSEGDYDPSTGSVSGDGEDDYSVTVLPLSYRDRDIDGSRILATDKKYILAANGLAVVPKPGDFLQDGTTYTIITPKTYEVAGTVIAYVLQVRNVGGT